MMNCFVSRALALLAATTLTPSISSTRLIHEQIQAYKTLLQSDTLSAEGLLKLLTLHDNDTVCKNSCERYLKEFIGENNSMEWTRLEELIETLYGGMISDDPYQPQEIHLALTKDASEMKVMWVTMENLIDPFVEYTSNMNEWDSETTHTATAMNSTYTVPQNWYPIFGGVIYEANMINLEPGKVSYRYRVGGYDPVTQTTKRSDDFNFVTPPQLSPEQKTTFAMLGDQGTFMLLGFTTSKKLYEIQDEREVDVVMYAGDLCYAGMSGDLTPFNNVTDDDEFGHIWDLWGIQNQPIAATRPFMTTPGNHESFYNWTAFTHRYKMPETGYENFWFSYDYGNVHMVSLSTEHCFESECDQMIWLKSDLEQAQAHRQTTPWIVVSMHRPVYCSDESQYDSHSPGGTYQTLLEPLFLQYDVDLVVQGHMHAYERIHPVENGVVTVPPSIYHPSLGKRVDMYHSEGKGPVYVVQGNTGAMQFEKWIHPQPEWSAIRFANGFIPPRDITTPQGSEMLQGLILKSNYSDTFGLGIATFANSTHLHYESIPVTGTIGTDEFWIVKRV